MQSYRRRLIIKWQRLIDEDDRTCQRCRNTEQELEDAFYKLKGALGIIGFQVEIEKQAMSRADFKRNPMSSNRIWINDKSLEEWLRAEVGKSKCCDVCGDSECRTLEFEGGSYEYIPSFLIIKAGLLAASEMISTRSPSIQFLNLTKRRT